VITARSFLEAGFLREEVNNMPIGNGPDYYDGINRLEDEQIKIQNVVDKWWHSLDDNYKFELLEPYYPDKLHLMGMDEAWNGLDFKDKWEIYKDEKEGEVVIR